MREGGVGGLRERFSIGSVNRSMAQSIHTVPTSNTRPCSIHIPIPAFPIRMASEGTYLGARLELGVRGRHEGGPDLLHEEVVGARHHVEGEERQAKVVERRVIVFQHGSLRRRLLLLLLANSGVCWVLAAGWCCCCCCGWCVGWGHEQAKAQAEHTTRCGVGAAPLAWPFREGDNGRGSACVFGVAEFGVSRLQ